MADFYLRAERGGEDLFAERRSDAGVLFASIPNFTEFYSEDVNEGVECIRLLNEIIIDFDEILDDEKFEAVEKIKTVGSTYMAASGITPVSDKVILDRNCQALVPNPIPVQPSSNPKRVQRGLGLTQ